MATVSPRPFGGSQPSCTEKTMMSTRPTQKVGRLKPRMEPAMMLRPIHEWGFKPATSPRGMPSAIAITMATKASSSVAGSLSRISWIAGTLYTNDRPRSPLAARRRNVAYCSRSGRSSPSAAVARARSNSSA